MKPMQTTWDSKLVSFEPRVAEQIRQWMKWDECSDTRDEVERLILEGNESVLKSMFSCRVSFGTAGIRAPVGAGTARVNELVYIQSAQGILRYGQSALPNLASSGVVVGFDGRLKSEVFARRFASVFLHAGVKVHWFRQPIATPLTSFAVTHCGAALGAMITASHNPKPDNGLKVYWSNGAQIVPPHDSNIGEHIESNLEPWSTSWDDSIVNSYGSLLVDAFDDTWDAYKKAAVEYRCYTRPLNGHFDAKIAFTAFHGVGYLYVPGLVDAFGFSAADLIVPVTEQVKVDGTFPTVKFPNPEEGEIVWKVAFDHADATPGCNLIIAVDPDADRFQVSEKLESGRWKIFSGNEMGSLFAFWLWKNWKKQNPDAPPNTAYMINSTVSSKMMKAMGDKEGFGYAETLTGFKWMGNKAIELRNAGKEVLIAWEESIGYMCGPWLDKDGILATAIFCEMVRDILSRGLTVEQQLQELYRTYGYHLTYISYAICQDSEITARIFDRLRTWEGKASAYPQKIGDYPIKYVRDLTVGYDSSQPDGKPVLPVSKSTQMITFTLKDSSTITVRGSGTEPKIKFYLEVIKPPDSLPESVNAQLMELKSLVLQEWIQPDLHKLELKVE